MRQYISNEKYELIKDNLDSKDTYVIVDGENVDKVAFRTNNITGQNAMYEIIPGATPTGTYNITENGEYDVAAYASAYVDVPMPEGSYNITENGEYDVAAYASAYVDVSEVWEGYYRDAINGTIAYIDSNTIPSGVTNLRPYAFSHCTSLTYVDLPNATSIGEGAFGECTGITYVDLPNVTSIGGAAFGGSDSLTTVDIGPNATSIGFMAFNACTNLTSFTCRATTPPSLGFSAFDDTHADLVIYVPAESVDTYKAESGWSDYADKIQAIAE